MNGKHEVAKFYYDEWGLPRLLAARSEGMLTDDGEAWNYSHSHRDARGRYDVLFRPTKTLPVVSPPPVKE